MMIALTDLDLIVYDFDGVMTDNTVLVSSDGIESVSCNRADGWAIARLKEAGITQIILSTETDLVVRVRAEKLGLEVMHGVADKKTVLGEYCACYGYRLERVMYVGNDVNDYEAMRCVGYRIAPADAHPTIKKIATHITAASGGKGVVRELFDHITKD